jgi:MFS family permease
MDLSPLRESRDLRLLVLGGGISFAGSMLTFVALPYQAYQLSHSSLIVGLLSLAELIPLLATAFIGGALADAVDRRRMIRVTEAALGLASGVLVVNSLLGRPQLRVLFVVSGVFAAADGLQRTSLAAIVPQIVRPEQLPATSAVMSMQSQLGMIAAPALTGVIIAVGRLTLTYSLDVASYLVSLGFLLLLGAMPPPPGESDLSLAAIRAGMSYAWRRKDLLGTYLVDMNAMFFGMPNALFPQIASHLGGASALGVLYASPALGSFVVTVTSGWVAQVRRFGRMIAVAAGVWGLGIILLGFASSLWLAAVGLVIAGSGDMVSGLARTTMWNQSIPDALRGRLAGIEMLSYSSGPALGNVEAGLLETLAGLADVHRGGRRVQRCRLGRAVVGAPFVLALRRREGEKLRQLPA